MTPTRCSKMMLQIMGEGTMPADALLVTVAVVAIFVVFAAVLAWADRQTNSVRLDPNSKR
jgi:hypothetical protein